MKKERATHSSSLLLCFFLAVGSLSRRMDTQRAHGVIPWDVPCDGPAVMRPSLKKKNSTPSSTPIAHCFLATGTWRSRRRKEEGGAPAASAVVLWSSLPPLERRRSSTRAAGDFFAASNGIKDEKEKKRWEMASPVQRPWIRIPARSNLSVWDGGSDACLFGFTAEAEEGPKRTDLTGFTSRGIN